MIYLAPALWLSLLVEITCWDGQITLFYTDLISSILERSYMNTVAVSFLIAIQCRCTMLPFCGSSLRVLTNVNPQFDRSPAPSKGRVGFHAKTSWISVYVPCSFLSIRLPFTSVMSAMFMCCFMLIPLYLTGVFRYFLGRSTWKVLGADGIDARQISFPYRF